MTNTHGQTFNLICNIKKKVNVNKEIFFSYQIGKKFKNLSLRILALLKIWEKHSDKSQEESEEKFLPHMSIEQTT